MKSPSLLFSLARLWALLRQTRERKSPTKITRMKNRSCDETDWCPRRKESISETIQLVCAMVFRWRVISCVNLPVPSELIPSSAGRRTTILMLWLKMSSCNQDVTIRPMTSFMRGISREHILYVVKSLAGCTPNPYSFRLVESRYHHKRISFLSALSPITVHRRGCAILRVSYYFSKCIIQCLPLSTCEHRCTGESKAWMYMVYLKGPL